MSQEQYDTPISANSGTPAPPPKAAAVAKNPVRRRACPMGYEWLKAPSILLLAIGLLGVLSSTVDYFEEALSFLQLPPLTCSIIIAALACVLMSVSLFARDHRRSGSDAIDFLQDSWRSI
ncbi:MAG: hypothetical protein LLF76_05230 [Planctomycetaceae bacterium]|nr:hypothetical protein [Planctomycetaceae bacterium]